MSAIDVFSVCAWHASVSLNMISVWEAKTKVVQSGHMQEKAPCWFSFSFCKHPFDQDCPFLSSENSQILMAY